MYPFAPPTTLPPDLARAKSYWDGLLRGAATMPFWDDYVPADLGDLQRSAFTLEVFDKPERFRIGLVGEGLRQRLGGELGGVFLGEGEMKEPFGFLLSQASATVESGSPTLHVADGDGGYSRLLLPMWGEGRVGMILGVLA